MPRIVLVGAGGTLTAVGHDRLDLAFYADHAIRLGPAELLARIPEHARVADVEPLPFRVLDSRTMHDADWLDMLRLLTGLLGRPDVAGAVVTHGTSALEETAYFLHLSLESAKPVVLVGSMRPASGMSSDADLNLLNAIRVAAAEGSGGRGVLVVMGDGIHSARDATKPDTYRIDAAWSRGPLGHVGVDGRVSFHRRPDRRHTYLSAFRVADLRALPRVDIVVSYVQASGTAVDALVEAGARGIVVAGSGPGRPTDAETAALRRAREKGVLVCLASRVGSGRVVRGGAMERDGFVAADDLLPWKARILLSLALTRTDVPDQVQGFFDAY